MRSTILSLESVGFQSTAFYDDLTQVLEQLRAEPPTVYTKAYYARAPVQALLQTISVHTGLNVMWNEALFNGPPTMVSPLYTLGHIFIENGRRTAAASSHEIAATLREMERPLYRGTIDLKNARISGDFCKFPHFISMPHELLSAGTYLGAAFSAREVAALVLHEVGHAFTSLEYMNRVVSTNQVLSGVSAALLSNQPEDFELALSMAQLRLELNPEQTKALRLVKSAETAGAVLATACVDKCRSELGESVFDDTSCEMLADQFAARCGAARELVLALARVSARNPQATYYRRLAYDVASFALASVIMLPILLLVSFTLKEAPSDAYGTFHSRVSRLRADVVQRLKDRDLDVSEKNQCLEALKEIDAVLATEADRLTFYEGMLYLMNGTYRAAHKYEVLQRQLEAYTHNSFFGHAAKFSTL